MALNVILLSQTAGYIIVFILALCVNIPLAVNFVEFKYVYPIYIGHREIDDEIALRFFKVLI